MDPQPSFDELLVWLEGEAGKPTGILGPMGTPTRLDLARRLARTTVRVACPSEDDQVLAYDKLLEPDTTLLLTGMVAAQSTVGECRLQTPYAPLRPVLTDEGLHWCCLHDPEHCTG